MRRPKLLIPLLAVFAARAVAAETLLVRATSFVTPAGELQRGAALLIESGKIQTVAESADAAKALSGSRVDEYPDAVLCPGLIDLDAQLSAVRQLGELADAIQPDATAADAFDAYSRELGAALRAGVTTFVLAPDDQNLIGGRSVICSTGIPATIRGQGPLKLSLAPVVYRIGYEPSSRGGAVAMLRRALEHASKAADADANPLRDFVAGRVSGVVTAPFGADVIAAAELAQNFNLKLTVLHSAEAKEVAEVTGVFTGVVIGPLGSDSTAREAGAAAALNTAGRKIAIAGGLPHRSVDSLRLGASLAARAGLPAAKARLAITRVPAELLGVADQLGSIQSNATADLVVFSGDPLDLRSRVLAVYLSGKRVYAAPMAH